MFKQYVNVSKKMQWALTRLALQAARRTWRPKTLQNRGQNPKKSMLKNDAFLASILEGFRPRFGEVFETFFFSEKCTLLAHTCFEREPEKYQFSRGKIDIFRVSKITQMLKLWLKTSQNSMFFGTSFLEAFHVLRTYRRAARRKRDAHVHAMLGFLQ